MTPAPPLHKAGQEEPQQDQAWDGRVVTFIASTGEPDRNGNILDPQGWDLKNYRRNPVVLFAHNWSLPPVGKALSIGLEGQLLKATVQFAPTALGQELALLNADGYLRAISVGARPLEWEVRRHPEHGFPIGIHSHKQELMELSIVPVPANPATVHAALSAHPEPVEGPWEPALITSVWNPTDQVDLQSLHREQILPMLQQLYSRLKAEARSPQPGG